MSTDTEKDGKDAKQKARLETLAQPMSIVGYVGNSYRYGYEDRNPTIMPWSFEPLYRVTKCGTYCFRNQPIDPKNAKAILAKSYARTATKWLLDVVRNLQQGNPSYGHSGSSYDGDQEWHIFKFVSEKEGTAYEAKQKEERLHEIKKDVEWRVRVAQKNGRAYLRVDEGSKEKEDYLKSQPQWDFRIEQSSCRFCSTDELCEDCQDRNEEPEWRLYFRSTTQVKEDGELQHTKGEGLLEALTRHYEENDLTTTFHEVPPSM